MDSRTEKSIRNSIKQAVCEFLLNDDTREIAYLLEVLGEVIPGKEQDAYSVRLSGDVAVVFKEDHEIVWLLTAVLVCGSVHIIDGHPNVIGYRDLSQP